MPSFFIWWNMKRKITYLLKDFDEMMKEILIHVKDFSTQSELLKNKEQIIEEIDKMCKKYDRIIMEIKHEKETDYEV